MEKGLLYVKYDGLSTFKMFDYKSGNVTNRAIYCTLVEVTEENKNKLQRLADNNKHINLKVQLRKSLANRKVIFETK